MLNARFLYLMRHALDVVQPVYPQQNFSPCEGLAQLGRNMQTKHRGKPAPANVSRFPPKGGGGCWGGALLVSRCTIPNIHTE